MWTGLYMEILDVIWRVWTLIGDGKTLHLISIRMLMKSREGFHSTVKSMMLSAVWICTGIVRIITFSVTPARQICILADYCLTWFRKLMRSFTCLHALLGFLNTKWQLLELQFLNRFEIRMFWPLKVHTMDTKKMEKFIIFSLRTFFKWLIVFCKL